jgi:hypothetical protein
LLATVLLVGGLSFAALGAESVARVPLPAGRPGFVRVLSSLPQEADLTMEQAARYFLDAYFGLWSEDNLAAMAFVEGEYAELVDFYGKPTPRQTIVELKRKFAERWPERTYVVRPGSLRIACNGGSNACLISGVVDWDCRSTARGARSAGVSDFTLRVAFAASGAAKVVLEASSVMVRSAAP